MRAVSIQQPWATLIAKGEKRFRACKWSTPYRGVIAIHAAKKKHPLEEHILKQPEFRQALWPDEEPGKLTYGAVVGWADLVEIHAGSEMMAREAQLRFGDPEPKPAWIWEFESATELSEPWVMAGQVKIFQIRQTSVNIG